MCSSFPQEVPQPWYEEDAPCVHSGFYWPPEATSTNNHIHNGKPSMARAYPTPPSHSPSPGPSYYHYEGVPNDSLPYSYHRHPDDQRRSYSPLQTTNMDRLIEYNEQKILSQHRLERCVCVYACACACIRVCVCSNVDITCITWWQMGETSITWWQMGKTSMHSN